MITGRHVTRDRCRPVGISRTHSLTRGVVIDNRGTSDWPRVRLDDGRRITVDAESGELRRE
jgi:hypothetical protein